MVATDPATLPEFIALDLETTGLTPGVDRIVEVAAVRFDAAGNILATFERLVNPGRPSGLEARALHGISDAELAGAEPATTVLPAWIAFLQAGSGTLLAHHSASDAGFLGSELLRLQLPIPDLWLVDTLAWARRRWPTFGNHRLDSLASRLGAPDGSAHRAMADSLRLRHVFLALQALPNDDNYQPPAYPIHDGAGPAPAPRGWGLVVDAIARGDALEIEYAGGTRGLGHRQISPQRFALRGGVAYLVALCHLDRKVKEFQIERVRSCRVVRTAG